MTIDPLTTNTLRMDANNGKDGGSSKDRLRAGSWSVHEEDYVHALIEEFQAGFLDLPRGTSLRQFLATMLRCRPKRISKKFEGNLYSGGRKFYLQSTKTLTPQDAKARRARLEFLEKRFKDSVADKRPGLLTSSLFAGRQLPDDISHERGNSNPSPGAASRTTSSSRSGSMGTMPDKPVRQDSEIKATGQVDWTVSSLQHSPHISAPLLDQKSNNQASGLDFATPSLFSSSIAQANAPNPDPSQLPAQTISRLASLLQQQQQINQSSQLRLQGQVSRPDTLRSHETFSDHSRMTLMERLLQQRQRDEALTPSPSIQPQSNDERHLGRLGQSLQRNQESIVSQQPSSNPSLSLTQNYTNSFGFLTRYLQQREQNEVAPSALLNLGSHAARALAANSTNDLLLQLIAKKHQGDEEARLLRRMLPLLRSSSVPPTSQLPLGLLEQLTQQQQRLNPSSSPPAGLSEVAPSVAAFLTSPSNAPQNNQIPQALRQPILPSLADATRMGHLMMGTAPGGNAFQNVARKRSSSDSSSSSERRGGGKNTQVVQRDIMSDEDLNKKPAAKKPRSK